MNKLSKNSITALMKMRKYAKAFSDYVRENGNESGFYEHFQDLFCGFDEYPNQMLRDLNNTTYTIFDEIDGWECSEDDMKYLKRLHVFTRHSANAFGKIDLRDLDPFSRNLGRLLRHTLHLIGMSKSNVSLCFQQLPGRVESSFSQGDIERFNKLMLQDLSTVK